MTTLTLSYSQKKKIANDYIGSVCGLTWDDLGDINSLHDAETPEDIIFLCKERLSDDMFPESLFD